MKKWTTCCALYAVMASVNALPATALSKSDQKQMDEEVKQGQQVVDEIKTSPTTHLSTNSDMIARVERIGQKLAVVANSTSFKAAYGNDAVYPFVWHFRVVESEDVNAFALPGGNVYVNSGLLKLVRTDDELAAVIGHEITHAAHHHAVAMAHAQGKMDAAMAIGMIAALLGHVNPNTMADVAATAQYAQLGIMNQRYSQPAERDADHTGMLIMQKAGYNPLGMLSFMMRLHEIEAHSPNLELGIFKDHPYTDERISAINAELSDLKVVNTPAVWRAVTGAARATVLVAGQGVSTVQIGESGVKLKQLVSLNDPDGSRSRAAAAQINTLLDSGLTFSQVRADGADVIAGNVIVLSVSQSDAELKSGMTPSQIAKDASRVLQNVLYAQQFMASHRVPATAN